ncbi:hypothetical protein [Aureliella helgolandensis]|nr:hypothetical protein [Aureliella helgolandensis]
MTIVHFGDEQWWTMGRLWVESSGRAGGRWRLWVGESTARNCCSLLLG